MTLVFVILMQYESLIAQAHVRSHMKTEGNIINIASTAGWLAGYAGGSAYCASTAAGHKDNNRSPEACSKGDKCK